MRSTNKTKIRVAKTARRPSVKITGENKRTRLNKYLIQKKCFPQGLSIDIHSIAGREKAVEWASWETSLRFMRKLSFFMASLAVTATGPLRLEMLSGWR